MKPQFTQYQISNIDGEEKHIQYFMNAIDARLQNVWTQELDPQVVSFGRLSILQWKFCLASEGVRFLSRPVGVFSKVKWRISHDDD